MQIRITDFDLDRALKALEVGGFGTRRQIETASIFTQRGSEGPQGYEVGVIRREKSDLVDRYEMVLETGRIPADRLADLIGRLATGTPLPVHDKIAA